MCGIAGYWGRESEARVRRMTRLLAHRGPDDEGIWACRTRPLALGNRRLKILDLSSEGHQPMTFMGDRGVLTFNGEIYNHASLREELLRLGYEFRSRSDTEVLLAVLVHWGVEGLQRLNGMFAFAYWDSARDALLLGRDRLGIKPLYYAHNDGSFGFSSEIRSLLSAGLVRPALDPKSLRSFLRLLWIPDPGTLFHDIHKVEPGTIVTWNGTGVRRDRYWEVPEPGEDSLTDGDYSRIGRELRDILRRSVGRQLNADVPVGAFLSGGLDSTTVVALAAEAGARDLRTYSVGFSSADRREDGALDDLRYSRLVSNRYRLPHEEIVIAPHVVDLLPKMVRHLEDPVADPAAINCFLICEAARKTSTVLLSGTGADELFGGYSKYVATLLGVGYQRLNGRFRRGIVEPLVNLLPVVVGRLGLRTVRRAKLFLRYASEPAFDRFAGYTSYYDAHELAELLGADAAGTTNSYAGIEPLRAAWDSRRSDDLVDRMTYVDLKYYLPGLGLAYMDRASMAASVEVRVPLLDDEVVDFVARLPGRFKVDGSRTKVILREAVRGLVPDEVLNRPKAPFAAPVRSWLRRELAPLIDEYLSIRQIESRGLLSPDVVWRLIRDHRQGLADHSLRIWAFLTLEVWLREFIDCSLEVSPSGAASEPVTTASREGSR